MTALPALRVPEVSLGSWPRRAFLSALLATLAGCGASPSATYDLNAVEAMSKQSRPSRGELAVLMPQTTSLIDTQRIVVRTGKDVAYLKGAEWADKLPHLLQARLIESFEKSHRPVIAGPSGEATKYRLETNIRRFEADVTRNLAIVEIYVRLLAGDTQIVAAQGFAAEAPSPHDDGATVTSALDEASAKVMRQIVAWTAAKI